MMLESVLVTSSQHFATSALDTSLTLSCWLYTSMFQSKEATGR